MTVRGGEGPPLSPETRAMPGAVYSRTSGVDSHHRFYRYTWAIHRDGELVMPGYDVAETAEDGRVRCVMGFFGPLLAIDG